MHFPTLRPVATCLAGLLFMLGARAATDTRPPEPGRYAARLCVQSLSDASRPPDCGPVELWLQRNRRAELRISDITYRLQWHSSQVDVVLMHGAMQIDEFTGFYEWAGSTLTFADRDKNLRYELLVGSPTR